MTAFSTEDHQWMSQALRLWKCRAERSVAEQDAFGVEVRLTMSGEFARNTPEALEIIERHAIEAKVGAEGVDAVFSVTGVVHEVECLVPRATDGREHDGVHCREGFGVGRRTTPVACRAAIDGVDVHQGDQRPGRARIGHHDLVATGVANGDGELRRTRRSRRQPARYVEWGQWRSINFLCDGGIYTHGLSLFVREGRGHARIRM